MRKPRYRCRHCAVTFIGIHAVIDWSEHTWTHVDMDNLSASLAALACEGVP